MSTAETIPTASEIGWPAAAAALAAGTDAVTAEVGMNVAAVALIIDALTEGGAEAVKVDGGGTGAGSYIRPDRAWTTVRNGGVGASAWLARVVGTHPKYKLDRDFVTARRNLSGSGRSGSVSWEITEPGLYSYGRFCGGRTEATGFFVTDGRLITEVTAAAATRIAGALDLELIDLFDD